MDVGKNFIALLMISIAGAALLVIAHAPQAHAREIVMGSGDILYSLNDTGVSLIDSSNGTVLKYVPYPAGSGNKIYKATLSPDGSTLFILSELIYPDYSGYTIPLAMDTKTFEIAPLALNGNLQYHEWGVPDERYDIAMNADASRLFVIKNVEDRDENPYVAESAGSLCIYARNGNAYDLQQEMKIPGSPVAVAASSDGSRVIVIYVYPSSAMFGGYRVLILDLNAQMMTLEPTHSCVQGVAMSPDGSRLYLAYGMINQNFITSEIGIMDTATGNIEYDEDQAVFPYEIAISPDGRCLFVEGTPWSADPMTASFDHEALEYIDTTYPLVSGTVDVPYWSRDLRLSGDGKYAYISDGGHIYQLDASLQPAPAPATPSLQVLQSFSFNAIDVAPSQMHLMYSVYTSGGATPTPAPIVRRGGFIFATPTPAPGQLQVARLNLSARYSGSLPNLAQAAGSPTTTPVPGIQRMNLSDYIANVNALAGLSASNSSASNSTQTPSPGASTPPASLSPSPSPCPCPSPAVSKPAGDGGMMLIVALTALFLVVNFLAMRAKR